MCRILSAAAGLAIAMQPVAAAMAAAVPGWNVTDTGQPFTDAEFTVREGTWMSLAVSPDGQTIAFDLLGDIYTMPATGGEARVILDGPAMQIMPKFSADGRKLLFQSDADGSDNFWVADADGSDARQITHETTQVLQGPAWGPGDSYVAGARLYSESEKLHNSELRAYDLRGGGGTLLVPMPTTGEHVHEAAFSPDGRYLYYTQKITPPHASNIFIDAMQKNYAIMRRTLANGETEQLIGGFGGATTPEVSPDGKRIAFVRRVKEKDVLFLYDVASGAQTPVWDRLERDLQSDFIGQGHYYPQFGWFPDNRHVAIWAGGKLWKVDMESGQAAELPFVVHARHRLTTPPRFTQDMAPKQVRVRAIRQIAAAPTGGAAIIQALGRLWRIAAPGATPVRLPGGDALQFEATWSPDARRIAWVEWNDEKTGSLKVAAADGSNVRTLVSGAGVVRNPSFSPDGTRIFYKIDEGDRCLGGHNGKPGLYWMPAAGGESHYITEAGGAPMVSPDGKRVYYSREVYTDHQLMTSLESVDLSGADKRIHAVTRDADTSELRPSPDLKWIAFRDRQQYYVTSLRETGEPLLLSASGDAQPVAALTTQGGYAIEWARDSRTLRWLLGPTLYSAAIDGSPRIAAAAVRSEITLTVPGDVPDGMLAFTGGRIITMRGDEVIENGTVLVDGNRISAVGPAATTRVPAGARVIDVSGKTIMPGLVDMHGHIDNCYYTSSGLMPQKQPPRFADLAYGVTTNYDPYTSELPTYSMSEMAKTGLMTGPRAIDSGFVAYGHEGKTDSAFVPIRSFADAQAFMARKVALGGTIVKSYRQPMRAQRQMLIKAGREAGVMVDVEGESHFYNNIGMILDGQTNLQHNMPVPNYYDDVVQLMAHAKVPNTPTLVVLFGETMGENYLYQTMRSWDDPKAQKFVQVTTSGYSSIATPYGAPPWARGMTTIQQPDELWDLGIGSTARSLKRLSDAGVTINAGSHGQVSGLSEHWEMWLLARGGMAPLDVLRTATINGAKTLKIDDQLGSIEPGKLADLIVLDRNPLTDIHNSNSVRFTLVNGRLFDSATMDEIGNHPRPRSRFFWELGRDYKGIDWKDAWAHQ